MCDVSDSSATGTQDTKQFLSSLSQISNSVDSIKESVKSIKELEQTTAHLSQQVSAMATEQARISTAVGNLQAQVAVLPEGHERSIKFQEQQLLEAKLTRLAAEKTAVETQMMREIAQREEASKLQQQRYAAYWSALRDALERLSSLNDQLAQQIWLLALKRHLTESEAAVDNLQSIVDKQFASETVRHWEELSATLLPDQSGTAEIGIFCQLREEWIKTKSDMDALGAKVKQVADNVSQLQVLIQSRSDSLCKERGAITGFFFDNFARSRYKHEIEEARAQLAQATTRQDESERDLRTASTQLERLNNQLAEVKTRHPLIEPFLPWNQPAVAL